MADKITAERQRNAIIALKALAEAKGIHGDVAGLQAAIESIQWLEQHREECKLAILIKRDASVQALFAEFPDAKISAVRKIHQELP